MSTKTLEAYNLQTNTNIPVNPPTGFTSETLTSMDCLETSVGYQILFFGGSVNSKIGILFHDSTNNLVLSSLNSFTLTIKFYFYQRLSEIIYTYDKSTADVTGYNIQTQIQADKITFSAAPQIFYITSNKKYYFIQEASKTIKIFQVGSTTPQITYSHTEMVQKVGDFNYQGRTSFEVVGASKAAAILFQSADGLNLAPGTPTFPNVLDYQYSYGSQLIFVDSTGSIKTVDFTKTTQVEKIILAIPNFATTAIQINIQKRVLTFFDTTNAKPTVVFLYSQCNKKCSSCPLNEQISCSQCNIHDNRQMVGGECICQGGYIDNDQNVCTPCSDPYCYTCFDIVKNSCQACQSGTYLKSDNTCSCPDGFYVDGTSPSCKPCSPGCQKCTSSTNCTKCYSINYTFNTNQCDCSSGFYKNSTTLLCEPCHQTCATCSGVSIESCITCKQADQIVVSGQCKCTQLNKYLDKNFMCQSCDQSCQSCNGISTYCLTCNPSTNRYLSQLNTCDCLPGFYEDVSKICQPCNVPFCKKCPSNVCTECQLLNGFSLNFDGAKCVCPSGYYLDINAGECMKCHNSCVQCDGPSSFNCLSCDTNRDLSVGKCSCKNGSFEVNQYCAPCNENCSTCTLNPNNCLSCKTSSHIVYQSAYMMNSCECDDGFYLDIISKSCLSCQLQCKTCSSSAYCLTCYTNASLNSQRLCSCNPGYYFDTNKCSLCDWSAPNAECQAKAVQLFRDQFNSYNCIEGYYYDGVSQCLECFQTCKSCTGPLQKDCKCHESCLTCTGPYAYQCQTCPGNFITPTPQGFCNQCQTNFFYKDNKCSQCNSNCQECLYESTYCTLCKSYQTLLSNQTCGCQPGYTDNGSACNKIICNNGDNCDLCSSTSPLSCISCDLSKNLILVNKQCICNDGYGLNGPNCVQCHKLCRTCDPSDFKKCLSCNQDQNRILGSNQCQCLDGFTGLTQTDDQNKFVCAKCHHSCSKCSDVGEVNCTLCGSNRDANCKCLTNYYDLGNLQNCLLCPPGTYTVTGNSTYCLPCDPSCQECFGSPTYCTKCQLSHNRKYDNNQCPCLPNYAEQNQDLFYCQPCPYFCSDCKSLFNTAKQIYEVSCNSCPANSNRSGGLCTCGQGFYNVPGDQICKPCHYSCENCIGPGLDECVSCSVSTKRLQYYGSNQKTFQCVCPSDHFEQTDKSECGQCDSSCTTCKGVQSTDCLSCPDPNMLLIDGKCQCMTGFYNVGLNKCMPCHYSCGTCSGDQPNQCLSCSDTTRVLKSDSTCPCIDNYFDDNPNPICAKCHYSCKNCSGILINQCTQCAGNRQPSTSSATTCVCPDGQQAPEGQPMCSFCHYSCKTCIGPSLNECLTCFDSTRTLNSIPPNLYGSCLCNSKYFDDQKQGACQQCHQSCLTCTGINPYQCLTCDLLSNAIVTNRNSKIPNCPCNTYYTESTAYSAICIACQNYCSSCDSTNTAICTDCLDSDNRILIGNDCICKDGYYQDASERVCQPCPLNCVTCEPDPALGGAPVCLTCRVQEKRAVDSNKKCGCIQNFYLLNDPGIGLCQPCDKKCDQCNPVTGDCTVCVTTRTNPPLCSCQNPLVENSISYPNCIQCHHSCKYNCFGSTQFQCLNPCDLNSDTPLVPLNRQFNPFLNTCSCQSGYSEDGTNPVCMTCSVTCETCDQPNDPNKCLTCSSSNFRKLNGQSCPCIDGYYDISNALCSKCHYSCKKCEYDSGKNLNQQCKSCDSDNFRYLLNGQCLCMDGYYDEPDNPICKKCEQNCSTCVQSLICQTCDSVQKRILDPFTLKCICQDGYVEISNICQPCDLSCKTCIDQTPTKCTSCESSFQREFITLNQTPFYGKCPCKDGFYASSLSGLCFPCHYSCYSCDGPLETNCKSCQAYRSFQTNKCVCPSNKFDVFGISECQDCPYYCLTCSSTNTSKCTNCDSSQNRVMNALTGYCDCNQGFYDDDTPTCKPCYKNCLSCRGPNQYDCISCDITKFRTYQNGVCQCLTGYYNISGQVTCGKCDQSCQTCLDDSSGGSNECTSCSLQQFRYQQGSFCLCINGYFQDPTSQQCVQCDSSCETCASTTKCATCNTSQFRVLSTTTNLCICMDGYYSTGSLTCQPCDRTCKTCSGGGPNQCLTCDLSQNREQVIIGSDVYCQCLINYFDRPPNRTCSKCHYSCKDCNGPNRNQCTSCDLATQRSLVGSSCVCSNSLFDILDMTICQQCHYSCVTCTDNTPSGCVSCPADRDLVNTKCLCKEGNIDDSAQQKCLPCNYRCATCSAANGGPSTCLTCNSSYFRSLVNNQCLCNPGYYDDGVNVLCQTCDTTCRTCSGAGSSYCLSCDATLFRTLNASNQCVCMNGYFLQGGVCQKCDLNCKTCTTTSVSCASCSSLMKLVNNKCVCENGYFAQGSSCIQCDVSCSTCDGPTAGDCLTCDSSDFRQCNQCSDLSQTSCQLCTVAQQAPNVKKFCRCQDRYFSQQGLSQCYPCNYQCLTCIGSNSCTSCDSVTDLRVLQGTQCQCQLGTYDAGISTCQPCHYSCQSCVQDSQFDCLSCLYGQYRQYNSQTKECACQSGFYDAGQKLCKQCDPTCLTCNGPLPNNCLSCSSSQNNREFNSLQKTCNCMPGFYNDASQNRCLPCHYSCATCSGSGPSSCVTCRQSDFRTFNSGQCGCNDRYFDNNTSQCASCHFSCKNCLGSLQTQCIQCDTANSLRQFNSQMSTCDCIGGYYSQLGVQQCQSCHYTCLTCRGPNPNQCTACLASAKRFMQIDNTCACDSGYYEIASPQNSDIKICVPCSPTCYTCSDFSKCTGCNQSDYRSLNSVTQQCECIDGYYEVRQQTGTSSTCQICSQAANRVVSSDKLSCVCKPGYFEDPSTSKCMQCSISCGECQNSKECTSCSSSQFRIFNNYQCVPIQGYFDTGQAIAQKCSQQCKNCVNFATNCISCRTEDGYTMSKEQTCVCQEGYQEVADVDTGLTVCRSPQSLAQKNANQDNVMWFYIFLCISGVLALIIIVYVGRRLCMKSEDPLRNPRVHALDVSEQDIFNQRPDETLQQLDNDNQNLPKIEQAQDYNFSQKKNTKNQTISPSGGDQIV